MAIIEYHCGAACITVTAPTELSFAECRAGCEKSLVPCKWHPWQSSKKMAYEWSTGRRIGSPSHGIKNHFQQVERTINGNTKWRSRGGHDVAQSVQFVLEEKEQHQQLTAAAPNDNRISIVWCEGHNRRLSEQWGNWTYGTVARSHRNNAGDVATPYELQYRDSPQSQLLQRFAKAVLSERMWPRSTIQKIQRINVQYNKEQHVLTVTSPAGRGSTLKSAEWPRACRFCASCVEGMMGRKKICYRPTCRNHGACIRWAIMLYQSIGPMDMDRCIPIVKFNHWIKRKK